MKDEVYEKLRNLIGKEFDTDDIIMSFDTDNEVIVSKIDYTTYMVNNIECYLYNAYINNENSEIYNIYINSKNNKIIDID